MLDRALHRFRDALADSWHSGTGNAAAIWHRDLAGIDWQARHGIDAAAYQRLVDELAPQGLRPAIVSGYGDGFYRA